MSPPTVQCHQVTVHRGPVTVLRAVDLEAASGEHVALVGPNGAGKSTLLHAVTGLLPARGRVRVAGLDPRTARRRAVARVVALVPQRPVVPPGALVGDLLALGRLPHGHRWRGTTPRDRAVVAGVAARMNLTDVLPRAAETLSGGELQRVMLARALCQEPSVLVLDEPTSALDLGHQQQVLDLVEELRRERGLTVLSAMHDLTLAGQYADRVVCLQDGRVVADGSPSRVLEAPLLAEVYQARVRVLSLAGHPAVVPVPPLPVRHEAVP